MNSADNHIHENHTHHGHGDHDHHQHTDHTNTEDMSSQEVIALLSYMIDHNKHHEDELHDLSHNMDAKASELVHEALKDFHKGNDTLSKALEILKSSN